MTNKLKTAIEAIKAGDKDKARPLLDDILSDEPNNEQAWLWMTRVVDSVSEQRSCLENVLELNPDNQAAMQALKKIKTRSQVKKSSPSKTPDPSRSLGLTNFQLVSLSILGLTSCVVMTGIGIAVIYILSLPGQSMANQAPPSTQVAMVSQPTEMIVLPTATAVPPSATPVPTEVVKPTPTPFISDVTYIGNLGVYTERDELQFYFSLYDDDQNYTRASGTTVVEIVNEDGETVFSKTREISEADFDFYTRNINNEEFEAAAFSIPLSDIQKSRSSEGVFYLSFTTSDGIEFETIEDTVFSLPEYSDEELVAQASQYFEQHAVLLNATRRVDNYIAVTAHRIGLMDIDDETYIRVDITVENIGAEKIGFYSPDPIILGKSSNQFEEAYISRYDYEHAFDSGDLYPGLKKSGALFFETRGNIQLDLKELIIETGLSSYYETSRNIGDGQALLYDKEYVFVYDLSGVFLK